MTKRLVLTSINNTEYLRKYLAISFRHKKCTILPPGVRASSDSEIIVTVFRSAIFSAGDPNQHGLLELPQYRLLFQQEILEVSHKYFISKDGNMAVTHYSSFGRQTKCEIWWSTTSPMSILYLR